MIKEILIMINTAMFTLFLVVNVPYKPVDTFLTTDHPTLNECHAFGSDIVRRFKSQHYLDDSKFKPEITYLCFPKGTYKIYLPLP
jgi:hypothetical protein